MDLSMRGMKEMREEPNADLLRRIAYLTKGQLMGEILFYIFLLSSIVYLIVGKVYKSIVDISLILGNLITVIFDYQIPHKPLKILSL